MIVAAIIPSLWNSVLLKNFYPNVFSKDSPSLGPLSTMLTEKKIRFDLSVEMRYNQDTKNEM